MKKMWFSLLAVTGLSFFALAWDVSGTDSRKALSCATANDTVPKRLYRDLYTGDTIDLWYDSTNFRSMNRRNNQVIDYYYDPMTHDTFYGAGGFLVNTFIVPLPNGKYVLDSTKVKIENNKIKIVDGKDKLKIKQKGDSLKVKKG